MLCQNCKQRQASTHIKRMIGGRAEELHLCAECAQENGLGLPELGFQLSDLFGGLLAQSQLGLGSGAGAQLSPAPAQRCGLCGVSLHEIVQSGRVGCAQCYETFRAQLEPTLQRIHGSLEHCGSRPEDKNPDLHARQERERLLNSFRERIAAAVKDENYEEAARLRDEIRRMEEGGEGNG